MIIKNCILATILVGFSAYANAGSMVICGDAMAGSAPRDTMDLIEDAINGTNSYWPPVSAEEDLNQKLAQIDRPYAASEPSIFLVRGRAEKICVTVSF